MPREAFDAARPYLLRAAGLTLVFLVAAIVANVLGQLRPEGLRGDIDPATTLERAIAIGAALVALAAGLLAVRAFARAIRAASASVGAAGRGSSLAFVATLVGYLIVLFTLMGALGVPLQGIFLGGALTGIVLGIAAQQTIGNFFAGIVILTVRPFSVGDDVVLRSAPLGGLYEGRVTDMTLFYVHLRAANGPVALPNSMVLAAAVGPGAKEPESPDVGPAQATG